MKIHNNPLNNSLIGHAVVCCVVGSMFVVPDFQRSLVFAKFSTLKWSNVQTAHSLLVTGSGASIQIPSSASLNITGSLTVEAWINSTSSGSGSILQRCGAGPNVDGGYMLSLSGGKPQFHICRNDSQFEFVEGQTAISAGTWQHVAGVFDGTQLRIFLNGLLIGAKASSINPAPGTSRVSIGAAYYQGGYYESFRGLIDEVRVSADAVYGGSFTPEIQLTAAANTAGLWKFDGQTARDFSNNGNDGSSVLGSSYSTDVPLPSPQISSVAPSSGPQGMQVTVTGINFSPSPGSASISFNGVMASPTSWSETSITVSVPACATTGPVIITSGHARSNPIIFTVFTGGGLTGRISRLTDGVAVGSALIELLQRGAVKSSVATALNGSFSLLNIKPGIYDLRVSAEGYESSTVTAFSIQAGQTKTIDLSVSPRTGISGRVTKSDGVTPMAAVTIRVLQGTTLVSTTITDGIGNFTLAGLTPGSYAVEASIAGYLTTNVNAVVNQHQTTQISILLTAGQ